MNEEKQTDIDNVENVAKAESAAEVKVESVTEVGSEPKVVAGAAEAKPETAANTTAENVVAETKPAAVETQAKPITQTTENFSDLNANNSAVPSKKYPSQAPKKSGFEQLPKKKKRAVITALVVIIIAVIALCALIAINITNKSNSDSVIDTSDLSGGVAAQVGDVKIGENAITAFIQNYRKSSGYSDDSSWASYLQSSGYTASSLRDDIIQMYTYQEVINQAAASEGVSVSDSDVDAQITEAKNSAGSDEAWQSQLSESGMTEDEYRSNLKINLIYKALANKVIGEKTASDEEVLSYIKTNVSEYVNIDSLSDVPESTVSEYRQTCNETLQSNELSTWLSNYKQNLNIQQSDMPSGLPYDVATTSSSSSNNSSSDSSSTSSSSNSSSSDSSSSSSSSSN